MAGRRRRWRRGRAARRLMRACRSTSSCSISAASRASAMAMTRPERGRTSVRMRRRRRRPRSHRTPSSSPPRRMKTIPTARSAAASPCARRCAMGDRRASASMRRSMGRRSRWPAASICLSINRSRSMRALFPRASRSMAAPGRIASSPSRVERPCRSCRSRCATAMARGRICSSVAARFPITAR